MYLNAHSYFSLRYGTYTPEELVLDAKRFGVSTMALTDINNTSAMLDFVKLAKQNEIRPIAGVEFRNENDLIYVGIAKSIEGFRALNEVLTHHNIEKKSFPLNAPALQDVFFIYPMRKKLASALRDDEYIGVRPHEVLKLFSTDYEEYPERYLVFQAVTFSGKESYQLHRHLRAIDNNILLSKLEEEMLAHESETFISSEKLLAYYHNHPQIVENTQKLIDACEIDFDFKSLKNRKTFTGNSEDDQLLLQKLSQEGFQQRYEDKHQQARERLNKELKIIIELGFTAYFLITWDIIRYSMNRGFYHVGRGSGANSIVAYCLKITDVDPIELDLYFERFINPKRSNPPDFDIDYSWRDRDKVQDYIFKRYGHEYTALLGTISTFKGKSMFRELGKVYGLPKEEIDVLVDAPEKEKNRNSITRRIYSLSEQMMDFPNLRSIHAGGVLISEKPINYYTALDLPPKGFMTTQWDMYVAEEVGFEKLDILSQRGIGHINDAVEIIQRNHGQKIDIHDVETFKEDEKVKAQLKRAETIGCFYIESPAMRGLLKKLRCSDYLTLVAASSIIRPGVAKSGMMREYIYRFHHPHKFEYLHPVMKDQLEETYGVMVYQEDVLKVCHHFAGLDLAESDVLRRAMSGKFRGRKELDRIIEKFFSNCKARGYPEKITKEVWRQIDSFAGYSFSKAHSASYAVESFQSLYLKAYYPLEFMTAVINNYGGFYHSWVYFNEAERLGANIKLPCVNWSQQQAGIIGKSIYIGFNFIEGFGNRFGKEIVEERLKNGTFSSLDDFVERVEIGLEHLIILIRVGAFRFTEESRTKLLWEAHLLLNRGKVKRMTSLFQSPRKKFSLPSFEQSALEKAYDEIEYLGMPVSLNYFEMLKTSFRGELMAKQMNNFVGKTVKMLGQLVNIKYVRTIKKEWMHFGTFIDAEGEFFDTVHFPDSLKKYPFKGRGMYLILGKIVEEFGYASMEVHKLAKLPLQEDPRS